jgi:hypothetical protein
MYSRVKWFPADEFTRKIVPGTHYCIDKIVPGGAAFPAGVTLTKKVPGRPGGSVSLTPLHIFQQAVTISMDTLRFILWNN